MTFMPTRLLTTATKAGITSTNRHLLRLSGKRSSSSTMTRRTLQPNTSSPNTSNMKPINLQLGWPSTRLYPKAQLQQAATSLLLDSPALSDEALIYGPDPGSTCLREAIAEWLSHYYVSVANPTRTENIFVANGASQALGIILERFTDPSYTQMIWMIEPTYFMACPIFEDAGFEGRLRGVPEDSEGIDLEYLSTKLHEIDQRTVEEPMDGKRQYKSARRYPKLYRHVIYVVPTFSNPSGKVMSLRRRQELITLARKHDALIIADDVYDMVRWYAQPNSTTVAGGTTGTSALPTPPPRMSDLDKLVPGRTEYGNACSNGSFSKIVAPGVRVSWVEGSPAFAYGIAQHGSTKSGGCPSQMTSLIIYNMLKSGALMKHLTTTVLPTYQERYTRLLGAIKQHLEPLGVKVTGGLPIRWQQPQENGTAPEHTKDSAQGGGFFCYIMFPDDLPIASEMNRIAMESYALKFSPGELMVVAGDPSSADRCNKTFGHGARLSWSWHEAGDIELGIERLALLIRDIRRGSVRPKLAEVPAFGLKLT